MSDSVRPHRQQPIRLLCPWDSPGKNTGVGCHFLLQCMKVKSESEVTQSCPTLSDPMDCSLPGSSVHGFSRQEYWSGVPLPSPTTGYTLWHFCYRLLIFNRSSPKVRKSDIFYNSALKCYNDHNLLLLLKNRASLVAQLVKNLPAKWETWVRPTGEGKGYPLRYSGLENSMDYIVHGVAKSWTQLNNCHIHY